MATTTTRARPPAGKRLTLYARALARFVLELVVMLRPTSLCTIAAAGVLASIGCEATVIAPGNVDDPRRLAAPVLDDAHLGWKAQSCESCHEVPVANHTETASSTCASCHGGNGACQADAPSVARAHDPAEDCVSCHDEKHGFVAKTECASCHYAEVGGSDCGSGNTTPGNGLIDLLAPNCYDLSNAASEAPVPTKTALAAGESAVEFTLNDRDGTPHSLSELLVTKPVALIFGAYT